LIATGFQIGKKARGRTGVPRAAAVVCLVLLALLAVAQVAHVHSLDSDADHCPLCIVMHSAAPIAVALIVIILVHVGAPEPVMAVRAAVMPCWHPSLFVRPPPIG
jgi:hypothetical protein